MPEITFLDELEAQLTAVAERDLTPRVRRPRRAALAAMALAIGLAVVALVAVDPFGASSRPAAGAATLQANLIEHSVVTTRQLEHGVPVTVREEHWYGWGSLSGDRSIVDDPANGGVVETADSDGLYSSYDAASNVIYERTAATPDLADGDRLMVQQDLYAVRRALAFSDAHDAGPVTVGGQALERYDFGGPASEQTCSYDVTRPDLVPVMSDCTNLLGHPWLAAHSTYAFLDETSANEALLSLEAQHPGARVDRAALTSCDQEPIYFGPGDPRNAPCFVNVPGG
jgi:hypothetical protein